MQLVAASLVPLAGALALAVPAAAAPPASNGTQPVSLHVCSIDDPTTPDDDAFQYCSTTEGRLTQVSTPSGRSLYRFQGSFSEEFYLFGELAYQSSEQQRIIDLKLASDPRGSQVYRYDTSSGYRFDNGTTCTYDSAYLVTNGVLRIDVLNQECTP
jgi:hypothetical protein